MPTFRRIKTSDKIKDKKTRRIIKSTARRYIDEDTGKIYTRRQLEKVRKPKTRFNLPKSKRTTKGGVYHSLVRDYAKKQKLTFKQAQRKPEFRQVIKDLERGAELRKTGKKFEGDQLIKKALEKTTRRDFVSEFITPGESPDAGIAQAA